jgi:PIN domain
MHAFIDTNIFLLFYQYSEDDLDELDKFRILLRKKEITLWLPQQVIDEYDRNREKTISTALKELKQQRLSCKFPAMSKGYGEHDILRKLQGDYGKHLAKLIDQISEDAINKQLKADKTMNSLRVNAKVIPTTDELHQRALLRHQRGNPPGKNTTIGDVLNWEALLASIPKGEPIHIITDDSDYTSDLDSDCFNVFLLNEWMHTKDSEVNFYKTLSAFFADKFPDIRFAPDLEKSLSIKDFVNSGSFSGTHNAVARLKCFSDFTDAQLNELIAAVVANRQIHWIIGDRDVRKFVVSLIAGREDKIDADDLEAVQAMLEAVEEDATKVEECTEAEE